MDSKYLIWGAGAILVLGIGAFALSTGNGSSGNIQTASVVATTTADTRAHLFIVRGHVFLFEADGATKKAELKDGDAVEKGSTLGTEAATHANVVFPDGSALRLDEKSRITLTDGAYDPASGKLSAKITLLAGNIWSKIVSLATPDSTWEVTTPHAVATVRGTAFGTSLVKGKTSFVGNEHTVALRIVHPKTKKALPDAELMLGEGKAIDITDISVQKIALAVTQGKKLATVLPEEIRTVPLSPEIKARAWVKEALTEDTLLNKRVDELRKKNPLETEFRIELRKTIEQDLRLRIEQKPLLEPTAGSVKTPVPTVTPIRQTAPTSIQTTTRTETTNTTSVSQPAGTTATPTTVKFAIKPSRAFTSLTEGESVSFTLYRTGANGVPEKVSAGFRWKVIGGVGAIGADGVFTAKLDSSVSEAGEAPGTIAAILVNPETGKEDVISSGFFKVQASAATESDLAI
ncbi:MAG: FecR family protein [Patescibacteria group bacterium]